MRCSFSLSFARSPSTTQHSLFSLSLVCPNNVQSARVVFALSLICPKNLNQSAVVAFPLSYSPEHTNQSARELTAAQQAWGGSSPPTSPTPEHPGVSYAESRQEHALIFFSCLFLFFILLFVCLLVDLVVCVCVVCLFVCVCG